MYMLAITKHARRLRLVQDDERLLQDLLSE